MAPRACVFLVYCTSCSVTLLMVLVMMMTARMAATPVLAPIPYSRSSEITHKSNLLHVLEIATVFAQHQRHVYIGILRTDCPAKTELLTIYLQKGLHAICICYCYSSAAQQVP